jgi:HD-GYP domain-containing protein (c-di-GMP phosphodiesterase class II)
MVRFSDIVKKNRRSHVTGESEAEGSQKDAFRLSDSMALKTMTDRAPVAGTPAADRTGIETANYYEKFLERAAEVQERVKADLGISPSPILSDLHYIIDKDLIDKLYDHAMSAMEGREDILVHTVDVTFTALKVGKGMDYDVKMLLRLGLAAFLENVGMFKIPDSVLTSPRRLNDHEIMLIKRHPEISYDILSRMGERYMWLADTALQVHERSDGSGYPKGLKGAEIQELASVVGLVDSYIAMIKNRPYREKFIQTEAVKSIVEASKGLFPSKIVKIFLNYISLFPINSFIKLNNGFIGRVIATDKSQPLRPTIELLYDGSGNKLAKPQIIRLSENPLWHIDASINSIDMT